MHKHTKRVIALVLTMMMLISVIPSTAFAAIEDWEQNNVVFEGTSFGTDGYYNVISRKDYTLVPGAATETEMVINTADGNRRNVLHILECDPSNPDISIVPGYYNVDKDITDVNNWQAAGMSDMSAKYESELGYNVVGAMNTALAYDNNAPFSYLVYNGQVLVDHNNNINDFHSGYCKSILCVYKNQDGTCYCELRTYSQGLRGDEWQAIGANFAMTVNNGQLVSKTVERTSDKAARSMVGVKEDGTLVLVMNDGRGANNSVGFNSYELGESMLALGCKWAFNCDGGGSSGFLTKRAGETEVTMRAVPCDGAERPTLNGIFVVSNVGPTGELNKVNINADYDYFAPGTSYEFGAEAIDTHGYAMDMPADATWSLSDASFGTIQNGTFTSNGTVGDVDVQVESGGAVVGSKTIHIANPTTLNLSATTTTLPYSTPAKVRTITLPMVAKIGENDVYTSGAYNISVSPANGGTVDGLKFTATDDTSVASATISIVYVPTNQTFTYTVNYGKGSETLWDFEDGERHGFVGTEEAEAYLREHDVPVTTYGDWSTPFRTLESGGQISWSNNTTTAISSKANGGHAHGGDKSLAVTFDMKNTEFNSWVYSIIWNIEGNLVLRDVANGNNATSIGCWAYIPKGFYTEKNAGAQAFQLTVLTGASSTATLAGKQLNMQYKGKNINALKESDIPENRWVYIKADLTGYKYVKLVDPLNDVYRSPSFARMYVKPSEAQEMTYYLDDFTIDYSSAVDDREPPVISNPTYCTNDTNIAFDNQTLDTNVVSFDANIADYAAANAEGLDYSSAKIYLDGVALGGVKASGNMMGVQNVTLSNGTHSIKFEIADKLGNATTVTKTITVNAAAAKSAVRLAGHNDKNNTIEAGSVYYVDVVADAAETIDSVTTTIELHSAHEWELDHMIVADGFEASYELDPIKDNIATITITNNGSNLAGEQTLVSLPARVWSFDENSLVGGDGKAPVKMTSAQRYASTYGEPVLLMEANVLCGEITYTDTTNGTFGGSISEETAVTGSKTKAWHEHTAHAVDDKPSNCLEEGYTGRTYCDECGSIVDWGTVVPTGGHDYEYADGKLVCSVCNEEYDYSGKTGLFTLSGKTYYAIGGNLVSGWQQIEDDWYYFNTTNFAATVGEMRYASVTYTFNDDGKLAHGEWFFDGEGYRYYYGPDYYRCHGANPYANTLWATIGGERYAFDRQGHRHEGISMLIESNNAPKMHEFTNEGVYVGEYVTDFTGVFPCNGRFCYLEKGVPVQKGLVEYQGDYYYINSSRLYVTGTYNCTNHMTTQIPPGTYEFGEDGKMLNVPQPQQPTEAPTIDPEAPTQAETDAPAVKNGIYNEGGKLWYYENGAKKQVGLIKIDGNYYYVRSGGLVATGTYYCTYKMTTQIPAGSYQFDETGKMLNVPGGGEEPTTAPEQPTTAPENPTVDPEAPTQAETDAPAVKNGIYNEGGKLWYYENGAKKQVGLIKIDGNYYYVRSGGLVATGTYYCTYNMTTQIPAGSYQFDETGKMLNVPGGGEEPTTAPEQPTTAPENPTEGETTPPQPAKDGLVNENGGIYYYKNGELQKAAGVIVVDGAYYFVRSSGRLATGNYSIGFGTHDYIRGGMHHFNETTGKMDIDPDYLVGIRGGRDIAFLNQTSNNVKVKRGMLYRGAEIDGAQYSKADVTFTEEDKANAVALLTEKGIKTEMDLRAQTPGCLDMLGAGVTHTYYDMVYYDEIFTAAGKAKIKDIFTELAKPENYPIYMHCTYGLDRTGTVCYLVEALLGFNDWNLSHDYCSTINSHEESILKVKNGLIEKYSGSTRKEQVTNYLLDCGLTQQQLDSVCELLTATE